VVPTWTRLKIKHYPSFHLIFLGCLNVHYNAELVSLSGNAGNFRVKFKKRDQLVDNYTCIECDKCIEVCPVEVGDQKAIRVEPKTMWENRYFIDFEHCTKCGKCEEVCPTHALKLERPEEELETEVGAIVLALEFDEPDANDLKDFSLGKNPAIVKNSEVAGRSLLTNFVRDSVKLPSGKIPSKFGIVVTPHFNRPGIEYENYNLCVSAIYRAAKLKDIIPEAEVTVFLRDYKGFGKGHYQWYKKALSRGVKTVKADSLKITPSDETAVIEYEKDNKPYKESVELAILVSGQKPPKLMEKISSLCNVKADKNGFCNIRPFSSTETDVDGIFAVGEFSGPKGNPETVWEGCAALVEALKYLGEPNFKPTPPPPLRDVSGEEMKVGVFICSCFGTFNEQMDLNLLKEKVKDLPGVAHAEIIKGCCTPPTIKETAEKIKESGVNRVVLAVCTPLQKLKKYQKTVMMAGLNPLRSEYVRLREDVINVHRDKDKMLTKALTLIRGAVEKVRTGREAPILTDKFIPRALVIGGGATGLIAAYEIATNGFSVTLVEREDKLGGNLGWLEKEQRDYVDKMRSDVETNSKITIYKSARIKETDGYAGNFHVVVNNNDGEIPLDAGVIILATGAKEYKPDGFLYGKDNRVMTQLELKEKLENGKIGNGKSVAMIQCIGSKDNQHPYCSRVCCTQALKNALRLRQEGSSVTVFYRDITSYGNEDYYKKAKEAEVEFVQFDREHYPEVKSNKDKLEVAISNNGKKTKADLVILSTGIVPDPANNEGLSHTLGYPLDRHGFFESDASAYPYEEAIKRLTKPYEWASNCIYPVGLAHSPRTFDESILTVRDAVGRAVILLGKGKLPPPNAMYVAEVKESLCMGCGVCVDACPYSARHIDETKKIAVVHPFLCDSCGACVAICPNDASYLRDFSAKQSIASLDSLLTD
jgi:heterodisulfide reductase subunit A